MMPQEKTEQNEVREKLERRMTTHMNSQVQHRPTWKIQKTIRDEAKNNAAGDSEHSETESDMVDHESEGFESDQSQELTFDYKATQSVYVLPEGKVPLMRDATNDWKPLERLFGTLQAGMAFGESCMLG